MMTTLTKNDVLDKVVYVKKEMPEVLHRKEILDGEPVSLLYDAVNGCVFHMKGSGEDVWDLIDGRRTVRMIAQELAGDAREESVQEALQDVIRLVVKLGEFDLIKYGYRIQ
jgi:hypothetical protein